MVLLCLVRILIHGQKEGNSLQLYSHKLLDLLIDLDAFILFQGLFLAVDVALALLHCFVSLEHVDLLKI